MKSWPDVATWRFGAVAAEECMPCCLWEFHRESAEFAAGFERWRKGVPKRTTGLVLVAVWNGAGYWLRSDSQWFPGTPWQRIPAAERARAFDCRLGFGGPAFERVRWPSRAGLDADSGEEILKVQINWAQSNERILGDFKAWLESGHGRPAPDQVHASVAAYVGRGKTPRWGDHLRDLGAYRLRSAGLTPGDLFGRKSPHDPGFADESVFNRARRRAEAILRQIRWDPSTVEQGS
jgi:hypothetical protein